LIFERRSCAVNGVVKFRFYRTEIVDGIAKNVQNSAESAAAHGNHDRAAAIGGFHAANETFGGLESDGADAAFAEVLSDFDDDVDGIRRLETFTGDANGVVNIGQLTLFEEDVDDGPNDLDNVANSV
jgi:hypothetical protein